MPAERSVDNDVERDLFDTEPLTFLYTECSTEQKLAQQIIENEINIMNDVELLFIPTHEFMVGKLFTKQNRIMENFA